MSFMAFSPHSARLGWGALRFFAGEGAKRTVVATPAAVLGTTALSPAVAAGATVAATAASVGLLGYSAYRWLKD